MSTTKASVTVICDTCGRVFHTDRTTTKGARGDAWRKGWRIASLYSREASSDFTAKDMCQACMGYTERSQPPRHYYWHRDGCVALSIGVGCTCDWRKRIDGAA